ncbi:MAG: hypothetical protein PHC61_16690 [Chitinivibrionales bacterium]|nr:hypothetical protein [Chitinivibrionales bacterium]
MPAPKGPQKNIIAMLKIPTIKTTKGPLFGLLFLCFAAAILGDSTAEALFLSHFPSRYIGGMFMVNAAFLFCSSAFLMSLIDRVDRGVFFTVFLIIHAAVLVLIRIAISANITLLYLPLFSYAYVTKIFLFLMFWTLANDLIDSRRAGYEFPTIAAGGTLGAIIISFCLPLMLRHTAAENMLMVWAGIVLVLTLLFQPLRVSFKNSFKSAADLRSRERASAKKFIADCSLIVKEPLLKNMAVLYFLLFFILLSQQYSFYGGLKSRFTHAKDMAAFLGYFNGVSMVATFILQMTLAGRVTKKIGSTRAMFFLPAVLCMVFGGLTYITLTRAGGSGAGALLFWGVVAGMSMRIAFFDSFFSPNFQVFFSGLPQEIRGRGKLGLEGIVKPFAMAGAGLWVLLAMARIPLSITFALLFILAAAMVIQTMRIKKKYSESLTRYLTGFSARKNSLFHSMVALSAEENFLSVIVEILEREEYEIKKYIIEILAKNGGGESLAILLEYFPKAQSRTRATILSALTGATRSDFREIALRSLNDPDAGVAANAITAIAALKESGLAGRIRPFLEHADSRVRAKAAIALWPQGDQELRREMMGRLLVLLHSDVPNDVSVALDAMGDIGTQTMLDQLEDFFNDHPQILSGPREISRQFFAALAKIPFEGALTLLLAAAPYANRVQRSDIARAVGRMIDKGLSKKSLFLRLRHENYLARACIVQALYHQEKPTTPDEDAVLHEIAREEAGECFGDYRALEALQPYGRGAHVCLLVDAVREESISARVDALLYTAAILDKTGQIRTVLFRARHPNSHIRGRALEVLDNVGDHRLNRLVMDLIDEHETAWYCRQAESVFKMSRRSPEEALAAFNQSANPWISLCARIVAQRDGLKPELKG